MSASDTVTRPSALLAAPAGQPVSAIRLTLLHYRYLFLETRGNASADSAAESEPWRGPLFGTRRSRRFLIRICA